MFATDNGMLTDVLLSGPVVAAGIPCKCDAKVSRPGVQGSNIQVYPFKLDLMKSDTVRPQSSGCALVSHTCNSFHQQCKRQTGTR